MTEARRAAWDRAAWIAGFALVSLLIYASHFASRDPDSALHAGIAARQAAVPMAHWVAPKWFGLWPGSGVDQLYLEHPAGIFLLPDLLSRLGLPAAQSVYVVGLAASLAALLLAGRLVGRLTSAVDARTVRLLLPIMPVAFIFRIRANHEYPMVACLLVALVGLDLSRRSWTGAVLVAIGFAGGLLIKGIFVVLVLLAAALWLLVNPTHERARSTRPWIACGIGIVAMAIAAWAYDAWYQAVTGHAFWLPYWHRQLGPVTFASPFENARLLVKHVVFYISRLVWDPAPWSVALLWALWRFRRGTAARATGASSERLGLWFVLAFAALSTVLLSVPSRFAERYTFSAAFLIGAAGIVAARRISPAFCRVVDRLDATMPGLPALVWTTLIVLRIGVGPWLPRIQDH